MLKTQTAEIIAEFFTTNITTEEFALYMRNFMHTALLQNLQSECPHNKEIERGYYWLTNFCEQIDPMLTKKDEKENGS